MKTESRYYFGEGDCPRASPQVMAHVLSQLISESGVSVLLRTTVLETVRENNQIKRLLVHNKSGLSWVEGQVIIDATGDGDIIAGAGEEFVLGSEPGVFRHLNETGLDQVHEEESGTYGKYEKSGLMQPVTLFFTMSGVDVDRAEPLNNRHLTYADIGMTRDDFLKLPYANTPGFEVSGEEFVIRVSIPHGCTAVAAAGKLSAGHHCSTLRICVPARGLAPGDQLRWEHLNRRKVCLVRMNVSDPSLQPMNTKPTDKMLRSNSSTRWTSQEAPMTRLGQKA